MAVVKPITRTPPPKPTPMDVAVDAVSQEAEAVALEQRIRLAPSDVEAWAMFGPMQARVIVADGIIEPFVGDAEVDQSLLAELAGETVMWLNRLHEAGDPIRKGLILVRAHKGPVPAAWVERLVTLYTERLECQWQLDAIEDQRDGLLGRKSKWTGAAGRMLTRFSRESSAWDASGATMCADETSTALDQALDEGLEALREVCLRILAECVRRTFGGKS